VDRGTRAALHVTSLDAMDAHPLGEDLDVRGSPAWSPDGASIAVAALVRDVPRLFAVPVDGGPPRRIVDDFALDPGWSPDGRFLVYSGAEVGPQFPVYAVTPDGKAHSLPAISLSRGARRLVVLSDGKLVVLRGEVGRGDLVEIDLASGAERTLVRFPDDFVIRDFDVSPDGREVVFDRLIDDSDLVLIDR
jgi:Tol biopolymer transport system component